VLVNNAGIFPGGSTVETDEATFDRVYAVNVKAPYFLTPAVAPAMAAREEGAVINLGSRIARLGIPIGSLYSSTKGALETLTRAWAAEFGPARVRVNAISPGVIVAPPAAGATGPTWSAPVSPGDDARHAGQHDGYPGRDRACRRIQPGQSQPGSLRWRRGS
jgi:NAD(P)-dependent dehydrogenase (short-subunit alcohol dehydrogenase family)